MIKEATFEDAKKLAQKLNLHKELVWEIIKGKSYSGLTDMAMAIQEALAIPAPAHRQIQTTRTRSRFQR